MEEEYREIEFRNTKLRVYRDGNIWRLCKYRNQSGKTTEKWRLLDIKPNPTGYLYCGNIDGKHYLFHRIVGMVYLGLDIDDKSKEIDHKNRIRNDNRVENLRIVTRTQNCWNRRAKGCYFDETDGRWKAKITVNKVVISLKTHETEEEAEKAYQDAKLIHHIII
jgi:HNH endonuclease/AP2 domain